MERKFYTVEEAAQMIEVSRDTIRRWIKAGKVPAVRIGRAWRIPAEQWEKTLGKQD